ncbi:MAG: ATP-binding protein [Candidatus Brocadiales bacterium]|nr:ATP-binding protein [Candidatus Brocadiales bacterium]
MPQEMNELDWKAGLSDKSEKLAQHLSAFANQSSGGFIVFGINNGNLEGLANQDYTEIIKKLGNIARERLEPVVSLDCSILKVNGIDLLFIYIPESYDKPVYIRGKTVYDSYIRSAGQTRKMSKQEVIRCISQTSHYRFEEELAAKNLTGDEILKKLDFMSYFDLLKRNLPENKNAILDVLSADKLILRDKDNYHITNLGAILFAKDLKEFETLSRKAVRVIIYEGKNRLKTIKELQGQKGYASGFEGLLKYINDQLPTNEVIEQALRKEVKMYPELAIRELVANALIHQDFYMSGTCPMIEIFSDRVEITNPGRPIINTMRFIDYPPQSRNEILASFMRRINICEERGSGVDKVIFQVEFYQLPAPDFIETENHLKVILYAYRSLSEMDKNDRIRACYQHCCLKYVSGEKMSNQTLRKRFNIADANYPMASRIISDTVEAGLIKLSDPESTSRKYAYYVPVWA